MLGFPTLVLSPGRREYMALGHGKFQRWECRVSSWGEDALAFAALC